MSLNDLFCHFAKCSSLTLSEQEGYPLTIAAAGNKIAPGLIDTVSTNIRIVLAALGVPVVAVLYYRMKCTAITDQTSHLFVAVDEKEHIIRIPPARLSMITGAIDVVKLKEYTASVTADPLGSLLLKTGGGVGERIHRFPPIFGFRAPKGEKQIYDRRPEIEALRRDGYIALTFLPVVGVDRRIQLTSEIASLWGYSIVGKDENWPDLLVLRDDTPNREDLGGTPDETWLQHALSRVMEDHLPIVELDGLWMGSLISARVNHSRMRVFYAVLDWVRIRRLPYITARAFHCYVRKDLSAVVALGSIRDRMELVEWLEAYPFEKLRITEVKTEMEAALHIFASDGKKKVTPDIAVKNSSAGTWLVIHGPESSTKPMSLTDLENMLRGYYGSPQACNAPGSPITAADVSSLTLQDLLKIVRVAECNAAATGVCLLDSTRTALDKAPLPDSWTTSHRAYRSAVRTHILRSHDTLGVYRMGPYSSPFFAFEVHQYTSLVEEPRYKPVIHQLKLSPDIEGEDDLLKSLVGSVWLLTVEGVDVLQVASDRDGEIVRRTIFDAWKSGYLIGTWCRVMLTHRDNLSISIAGGTVDPLIAHAGDSIVDGNRFLDVASRAIEACTVR